MIFGSNRISRRLASLENARHMPARKVATNPTRARLTEKRTSERPAKVRSFLLPSAIADCARGTANSRGEGDARSSPGHGCGRRLSSVELRLPQLRWGPPRHHSGTSALAVLRGRQRRWAALVPAQCVAGHSRPTRVLRAVAASRNRSRHRNPGNPADERGSRSHAGLIDAPRGRTVIRPRHFLRSALARRGTSSDRSAGSLRWDRLAPAARDPGSIAMRGRDIEWIELRGLSSSR